MKSIRNVEQSKWALRPKMIRLTALILFTGLHSAFAITRDSYQAIPNLKNLLQANQNEQSYLNAYTNPAVLAHVKEITSFDVRTNALTRYRWWWLECMAAIYTKTSDTNYLDLVRRGLLHEVRYPQPGADIGFDLSSMTHAYQLVQNDVDALLTPLQRTDVSNRIVEHANTCLTLTEFQGTEMNRGIINMLGLLRAYELYPANPNASTWSNTAASNWNNGFKRTKDNNENATSYNALWLYNMMQVADKLEPGGIQTFCTNQWVRDIFERHLNIRLPTGIEPMLWDHETFVANNPAIYEWAGKIYEDGRYRWAAQRMFNLQRAQRGAEAAAAVPYEPVFSNLDSQIAPIAPTGASYYSHRRYDRDYPDKFVLRSGYGPSATALFINLFHGGGHGQANGSSIYSLMDQYSLLLAPPDNDDVEREEQGGNLVLFRKEGDPFPGSIPPPASNEWRRTRFGVLAGDSATGGLNIYLHNVNSWGIRTTYGILPAEAISARNISAGTGTVRTKTLPNINSSGGTYLDFLPIWWELTGDSYLEFEWTCNTALVNQVNLQGYIDSKDATKTTDQTSRFSPFLFYNWRDSRVRFYHDFTKAHIASVEVDLYGYDGAGSNHKQYRDLFMLQNNLIWVRDTFEFGTNGNYQVGPLWHIGDIVTNAADGSWFQTRTYGAKNFKRWQTMNGASDWIEAGEPRQLLVVMPQRTGYTNGYIYNASLANRPYTLYQKWSGTAVAGQKIVFNTLLMPNTLANNPQALSNLSARVGLVESNAFAILTFDGWTLADNPYGTNITVNGQTTTNAHLLDFPRPRWWYKREVINPDLASDYGVANSGQLKWIATNACREFEECLATHGGAGSNITEWVNGFAPSNNYCAVNIGQLKHLAKPFYDRLWELGRTNAYPLGAGTNRYPWESSTNAPNDYAPANIGQVKYLFSFEIETHRP